MQAKRVHAVLTLTAAVIALNLLVAACTSGGTPTLQPAADTATVEKVPEQQFAAHFVDSSPAHGAELSQVPGVVAINFDFILSDLSSIKVTKNGKQVSSGSTSFSASRLTMSTDLDAAAGGGVFVVDYSAWWPDETYHDGRFAFTVIR